MRKSENFTILCISHLEWTKTLFQRPQQVMIKLSERHNVIYFREWWFKEWAKGFFKKKIKSFNINENFFIYNPIMPLPTLKGKLKIFETLNKWIVTQSLKRLIKKNNIDKLILWFYFPKFLELIEKLNVSLIVYECMDNYVALSYNDKPSVENIRNKEPYLLDKADIIFYGSKTLMDSRSEYRYKSHHIPTGVDVKHFSKAMDNYLPLPDDIKCIKKPILGYWGAVDERIDYKVLHYCAITHPEWSIVLLGPMVKIEEKDIAFVLNLPNVYWLGPKTYESLPDYARVFDICLLPFKQTDEGKYLNPTKTLEYLATGKPVISTKIPDMVQFYHDTVIIASNEKDFVEEAQKILLNDNEEKRNSRLSKTKGNSWDNMVEKMEQIVGKRLDLAAESHIEEKIATIVVTFNRKELLSDCLEALLAQTRHLDSIIIIDNASTDGTAKFLKEKGYIDNPVIDYVRLSENIGGAGGFYEGIKRGYEKRFDWLWLMDDDGVPKTDALQKLIDNRPGSEPCCLNSLVCNSLNPNELTYGIPLIKPKKGLVTDRATACSKGEIFESLGSPFNGFLLKGDIIQEIGLPEKNLFIWGDELEYVWRITKHNFKIYTCSESILYHPKYISYKKDGTATIDISALWKYYYKVRNMRVVLETRFGRVHGLLRYLYFALKELINIIFHDDYKIKRIKIHMIGFYDGLANKLGKRLFL